MLFRSRYRYLDEGEIRKLLEMGKDSQIFEFICVAAYTGGRFSEIHRLKWADVLWSTRDRRGHILLRGRKGSRSRVESPRRIPLKRNLECILQEYNRSANAAWVFSEETGERHPKHYFYWRLKKLTDGTDFEGIRFHTFRHSFASNLAKRGVDQRMIDRLMGHQTEAMRRRYQHLFPDEKQEAIEQLQF